MGPAAFVEKWAHVSWWARGAWARAEMARDLALVLAEERDRERRRLCTDLTYYAEAVRLTTEEIQRHEAE